MTQFTTPQRIEGLRNTTTNDYLARMARLQSYIGEHLDDEKLSPTTLAGVAAMSTHHFHRVFRGLFGESVTEYMRRLRLERGAIQLRRTDRNILRVAVDAGYGSHEAFTRAFKTHFDRTPSEFRATPSARIATLKEPKIDAPIIPVAVVNVEETKVLTLRTWGPYIEIGDAFGRLVNWALSRGISPKSVQMSGIYYDDPEITAPEQLRSDACLTNVSEISPDGEVIEGVIPAGVYAVAMHLGPYETLFETYLKLIGQWLPGSGYEPTHEPVVERYLNSPADTDPSELLTEVCVRLQES